VTPSLWLNASILAVSLANTILLTWLGLTVLLNTERRTPGLYLAGGALLLAGAFFLSHTAIISFGQSLLLRDIDLWWRAGWIPVTCLPFAWYAVMLWYGGYWEPESTIRQRHRLWFIATFLLAAFFVILLAFAHSLPTAAQLLVLDFSADPSMFGVPVLVLFYPFYAVLCTGLTLDVLRWPAPSQRAMADQARRRAWPWLGAASLSLFIVSLLVGGTVFWFIVSARQYASESELVNLIGLLDLLISLLISFTILLVGQAIVTYEVFTGKSLPRRGLQRYWRRAIILAFGYSLVVGAAFLINLNFIYILLLATLLLTVFYALLSWRSFEERERLITSLRPFLASQDLYHELLVAQSSPIPPAREELTLTSQSAFQALCSGVLETRLAYLVPLGPMAPLAGDPLVYPPAAALPAFSVDLPADESGELSGWLAVDPQRHAGAVWAVPLRGRGALSGVLFLGEKQSGALYTQEEVDVARLAGERLLDAQASAELARRLMALQRQHLAESQVLDSQARRLLHDEILPQLHEAILRLSAHPALSETDTVLSDLSAVHARLAALLRQIPSAANPEVARLGLVGALHLLVDEEYRSHFDAVRWEIPPQAAQTMQALPALSAEVVYFGVREAVRNAARYGRGDSLDRELHLSIRASVNSGLSLWVEDDGVGMRAVPLDARSAGAGQGLALHSTLLAVLGGTLSVQSLAGPDSAGPGTRVTIQLPQEISP